MTRTLITTSEINRTIKGILPRKIYSVNELIKLGFEPLFKTSNATYWEKDTGERLLKTLQSDDDKKQEYANALTDAYNKGYKDGRTLGVESGMRQMHNIFMEYLIDTHLELAHELQVMSDSFLRHIVPKGDILSEHK